MFPEPDGAARGRLASRTRRDEPGETSSATGPGIASRRSDDAKRPAQGWPIDRQPGPAEIHGTPWLQGLPETAGHARTRQIVLGIGVGVVSRCGDQVPRAPPERSLPSASARPGGLRCLIIGISDAKGPARIPRWTESCPPNLLPVGLAPRVSRPQTYSWGSYRRTGGPTPSREAGCGSPVRAAGRAGRADRRQPGSAPPGAPKRPVGTCVGTRDPRRDASRGGAGLVLGRGSMCPFGSAERNAPTRPLSVAFSQSRTLHALPRFCDSCRPAGIDPLRPEAKVVGVRGFEPPTSASRTQRSTKLSHTPTEPRILAGTWGRSTPASLRLHGSRLREQRSRRSRDPVPPAPTCQAGHPERSAHRESACSTPPRHSHRPNHEGLGSLNLGDHHPPPAPSRPAPESCSSRERRLQSARAPAEPWPRPHPVNNHGSKSWTPPPSSLARTPGFSTARRTR